MISEADIEKALDFLRDNAEEAAQRRAERLYLEEYRKSLKALIMKEHDHLAGFAQEREAYVSDRYIKHLGVIRDAVEADERQKFLREAAQAKITAWQTLVKYHLAMKI